MQTSRVKGSIDNGPRTLDLCQSCPSKRQKMMYQTGQEKGSRGGRVWDCPVRPFLYLKLHLQKRQLCFGVILILGLSCCVFRRFSGLGAGPVLPRYPFSFVMWPISKNSSSCCGFLRLFICVVLLDIYHKLIFCCCW